MTSQQDARNLWKEPGVAYYVALCLIALGVIMLVMLQRTYWVLSLLPILAGVGAGFTSFGPYLLVIVIVVCLNATPFAGGSSFRQMVLDFLLSGAVLAYVAGHYRLQCLFIQIFPPDSRRRTDVPPRRSWWSVLRPAWNPTRRTALPSRPDGSGAPSYVNVFSPEGLLRRRRRVIRQQRPAGSVTASEIQRFLMTLPLWILLALVAWRMTRQGGGNPGLKPAVWHGIVLAWLIGLTAYVAASAIGYWQRRHMSVAEATIYLQDQLWAETRREQRRLNRWLAWASGVASAPRAWRHKEKA
jgi:hypothetical protein